MTLREVYARLYSLGYLTAKRPSGPAAQKAIKAFQLDNGLVPDGKPGPQTIRALTNPLLGFCGVHEHIVTSNGLYKWPVNDLTWAIENPSGLAPRLSAGDFKEAVQQAAEPFPKVCGLELTYKSNHKTANIRIRAAKIDQGGNTLAYAYLPIGNAPQLDLVVDTSETWVIKERPAQFEIDKVRVVRHELTHNAGVPHIEGGNLMQPMYSNDIREFQSGDVRELQLRYGPPRTPVEPPATPTPSEWTELGWMPPDSKIQANVRWKA